MQSDDENKQSRSWRKLRPPLPPEAFVDHSKLPSIVNSPSVSQRAPPTPDLVKSDKTVTVKTHTSLPKHVKTQAQRKRSPLPTVVKHEPERTFDNYYAHLYGPGKAIPNTAVEQKRKHSKEKPKTSRKVAKSRFLTAQSVEKSSAFDTFRQVSIDSDEVDKNQFSEILQAGYDKVE